MPRTLRLVFTVCVVGVAACTTRTVQPPAASPELTRFIELNCPTQREECSREFARQVLPHLEVRDHISLPSQERWVPYAETESFIRSDAERLWNTGILESLWVEVRDDEPWANGVVGKRIIFNMVKREGDPVTPSGPPTTPAGFESPAPGHERLYP